VVSGSDHVLTLAGMSMDTDEDLLMGNFGDVRICTVALLIEM
jgi:hypothetical protein